MIQHHPDDAPVKTRLYVEEPLNEGSTVGLDHERPVELGRRVQLPPPEVIYALPEPLIDRAVRVGVAEVPLPEVAGGVSRAMEVFRATGRPLAASSRWTGASPTP